MKTIHVSDATYREIIGLAALPFRHTGTRQPDGSWLIPIDDDTGERLERMRLARRERRRPCRPRRTGLSRTAAELSLIRRHGGPRLRRRGLVPGGDLSSLATQQKECRARARWHTILAPCT
jgi:hypothetical protein